jgi:ADP-heptose:LPS heptosyltransferase
MIHSDWKRVRNILVVRLDSLGDVLMTTPAFRAVKETFDSARITLLTSTIGAAAYDYIPHIDEVMVFDAPWIKTASRPKVNDMDRVQNTLANKGFDAAIIFTVYSQNPLPAALFLYQARVPLRLSYAKENPYDLLTHWVPDPEPERFIRHEVERQLALVGTIGATTEEQGLTFEINNTDVQRVLDTLKLVGIG